VGIGAALVVGFDAGDGFVEPGGVRDHGWEIRLSA
jgi:hypothetical protein